MDNNLVLLFPDWYSMHINCGGREVEVDGDTSYEDDTDSGGSSRFFRSGTNWAFSSTGHFLDDNRKDSYIWTSSSRISGNNSQLYMDARLSPLSLTYYGFCLLNGNYTVNLHFAEIMFTDGRTYGSLGKRLFDIYIQVPSCHNVFKSKFLFYKNIRYKGSRKVNAHTEMLKIL